MSHINGMCQLRRETHISSRNGQIDGLRGFSILIICLFHIFCRYQQIYLDSDIWWMAWWGTFGTNIFMLITCWFLVDVSEDIDFSVREFIKRRFIRLWPTYAIAITITAIVIHIYNLPHRMSSWGDWILNLFFLNGFIGTIYVDGAHWYMTRLVSLILITVVLRAFRLNDRPWIYFVVCVFCFFIDFASIPAVDNLVAGGYFGFYAVIASVKWFRQHREETSQTIKIEWGGVLIAGFAVILLCLGIRTTILLLVVFPMFKFCLDEKLPFMENRVFAFLGTISYPLYLIHQNISFEVEYYMSLAFGEYSVGFGITALMFVVLLGYFLFRIDVSFRTLLKKYCSVFTI